MDGQNQNANVNNTQPQENTKFCKHCGGKIAEKAVICPLCGCQVEEIGNKQNNQQPIVINNTNNNVANAKAVAGAGYGRAKNKWECPNCHCMNSYSNVAECPNCHWKA